MKNPNGALFARDEVVWIQTFKSLISKLRELFKVKGGGQKNQNRSDPTWFFSLVNPSHLDPQTKYEEFK